MIKDSVITEILSLTDTEKGGDNALDGFEFQVSSAIYLMFSEIEKSSKFTLVYEKLEDFIIFSESIHLYQAKSISRSLTPNVLYKRKNKKNKTNNSNLSIIEKMQDNYLHVEQVASEHKIDNNLIICENQNFSKKLSKHIKDIKDLVKLNFNQLDSSAKTEIINKTKHNNYAWKRINAIRLIPKSRHEEVTKSYIVDVINKLIGENRLNIKALYDSLSSEIRRIRKFKSTLTYDFLMNQIRKFSSYEEELEYKDYAILLNDEDKRSIMICSQFNILKRTVCITNHPDNKDYEKLRNIYLREQYKDIDTMYKSISENDDYTEMMIRLDESKIKALLLLVVVKEMR